jgi:hypothetical protein
MRGQGIVRVQPVASDVPVDSLPLFPHDGGPINRNQVR